MDNAWVVIAVTFSLVLLFLATGMWVAIALSSVGLILLAFFVERNYFASIGAVQFNTVNSFTFVALPLFIFMGEILQHSGIGGRLYQGATPWVSFLPGGLLHTNIVACAIFSFISGSSMATAATIGTVAIPELEKRGYDRRILLGSLAAGGTLGILIPPSLGMIIYGVFVDESIGRLFMAGVFPGITLAFLFMVYISLACSFEPSRSPAKERSSLKALVTSLVDFLPAAILIFMVLGTLYLGVATASEAAALGALMAVMLTAVYRKLNWKVLTQAALAAVRVTAWLLIIIIGATLMSNALAYLQVPAQMAKTMTSFRLNPYAMLAVIAFLYILLGMFMDGASMQLLTLPVVYPLVKGMGFDGVWFGIFLIVLIEIGQITPPVAVNLYVIDSLTGGKYFTDIVRGVLPFYVIMIIMLVILVVFPDLALWLPNRMIKPF